MGCVITETNAHTVHITVRSMVSETPTANTTAIHYGGPATHAETVDCLCIRDLLRTYRVQTTHRIGSRCAVQGFFIRPTAITATIQLADSTTHTRTIHHLHIKPYIRIDFPRGTVMLVLTKEFAFRAQAECGVGARTAG